MKKILALFCVIVLTASCCIGTAYADTDKCEEAPVHSKGDIVTLGTYPQTLVGDSKLISELDKAEKSWKSYGYTYGNGNSLYAKSSDYMKFCDFEYDSQEYRAVTFEKYRPNIIGGSQNESNSNQDDNGYDTGKVYYFRFEPIEWYVIDPENGVLISKDILDAQPFVNGYYNKKSEGSVFGDYYTDSECTHYANDYSVSSLRNWLNEDFYSLTFDEEEQSKIKTVTNSNSNNSNKNVLDSTQDRAYILSYNEYSACKGMNSAVGSDYAKCQGLYVAENGLSFWRLRTGSKNTNDTYLGDATENPAVRSSCTRSNVDNIQAGIRPVISIPMRAAAPVTTTESTTEPTTEITTKITTESTTEITTETTRKNNFYEPSHIPLTDKDYETTSTACRHDSYYKKAVTAADFDSDGVVELICINCGKKLSDQTVEKLSGVRLKKSAYYLASKSVSPELIVKDSISQNISSDKYSVEYYSRSNNKPVSEINEIGQYKAVVTFKEEYSGSKTLYFSVKPQQPSVKSLKSGKKKITVKMKKPTNGSKYQICFSTNKKFKNAKTVTLSSKAYSKQIKKLKSGKKYYVRVRSFNTVRVDGKKAYMYSSWSKAKTVKTK